MKHKTNLLKIFVRNGKAYLSYEVISHLNLPGERISFQKEKTDRSLKFIVSLTSQEPGYSWKAEME